jgi:Family of unknown function (DUF5681)
MSDETKKGYRNPPEHTRFQKGRSGNPKGRPPKAKNAVDVAGILNDLIAVRSAGAVRKKEAFEVMIRALVRKAVEDEDIQAAIEFMRICEKYGIVAPLPPTHPTSGVLLIPRSWDENEWRKMFARHGPPPWPGPRSGKCGSANE